MTEAQLVKLYGVRRASPKAVQFLVDLHKLCIEHRVTIGPSGYDSLQIFDLDPKKPIWFTRITDYTEENYD